jgi:hypothetical protein
MFLFTRNQIRRFSNIFDNAGQVFLGSLVLTPLLDFSNSKDIVTVISGGAILTFFLWWLSLRLERISS